MLLRRWKGIWRGLLSSAESAGSGSALSKRFRSMRGLKEPIV